MTTPARVSGPGALSQRTDVGGQPLRDLPDAKYGEARDFMELQRAAPLAESPNRLTATAPTLSPLSGPPAGSVAGPSPGPRSDITPLSAPTTRPSEHVTTGAQYGPAVKPKVSVQPGQFSRALAPYIAADDSGVLAEFAWNLAEMGL